MKKNHQDFGKFSAQFNEMRRAHNEMKKLVEEQVKLLSVVRDDLYHASAVLRIGGYKAAAEKLNRTFELVSNSILTRQK